MSEFGEGGQGTPGGLKRVIRAIGHYLRGEPEAQLNPKSSQLWDVYKILEEESGFNTDQRNVLGHATKLFLDQVEKKTKAQKSKVWGYKWHFAPTPLKFEDEEYSLLTLKLIERFCVDAEPKVTHDLKGPGLIGRLNIAEITSSDIQRLIRGVQNTIETTGGTLWERFCQKHFLDSQSPEAQKHRQVIERGANRLYAVLHGPANNVNEVNQTIGEAFLNIKESRTGILTPIPA